MTGDSGPGALDAPPPDSPPHPGPPALRGGRLRAVSSVVLLVMALVLVPLALVSGVARAEFATTSGFVDTFGPLASRPEVQDAVATRITDQLSTSVVPGLVSRTLDTLPGSGSLASSPAVNQALNAGITSIIGQQVQGAVASSAFGSVWQRGLGFAHAQFVATVTGSPDATLRVDEHEQLVVSLGPVVATARERLVAADVSFAHWIPDVAVAVPVASGVDITRLRTAYRAVDLLGVWAPVGAVVLLAAALWASPRRRRTLTAFTAVTAAICLLLVVAVALARGPVLAALTAQLSSAVLAAAVYDAATRGLVQAAVVLGVLALLACVGTRLLGGRPHGNDGVQDRRGATRQSRNGKDR